MVCTRRKDYGEPPPLKQRRPRATQQDAITKPDAAAAVGHGYQDESKTSESHTDKQGPCTEFIFFPKLPPELRIDIWKASMTPRLVVVEPNGNGHKSRSTFSKKILPAHFSVNSESREYALRRYSLIFTIAIIADRTGRHSWDCASFEGTRYHARVVMSADDTLGFLGWEELSMGFGWKFGVESANLASPWARNPPITVHGGGQPEVKRVAFLGANLGSSSSVIHSLNSTVSWNLRSILHTESTKLWKLYALGDPWYIALHPAYSSDYVLIHSRNYNGSLQEWGERLMYRIRNRGVSAWNGAPDILAFELGMAPTDISRPIILPTDRNLKPEMAWSSYKRLEHRWRIRHRDPRGF